MIDLWLEESKRLLRHPAYVLGLLLTAAVIIWRVSRGRQDFLVLTNESWSLQVPFLAVSAGIFSAALLESSRSYRYDTVLQESVTPLSRRRFLLSQGSAVVTGLIPPTLLLAASSIVLNASPHAAEKLQPAQLVAVPAQVLMCGMLGFASAHLGRGTAAGVALASVVALLTMIGTISDSPWRWLTLIALEDPFAVPGVPKAALSRPGLVQALWLASLAAALFVSVLWVRSRGQRLPVLLAGVAAVGSLVVSGCTAASWPAVQHTGAWQSLSDDPRDEQVCRTTDIATYCYFPGFSHWVPAWNDVVRDQLEAAPELAAQRKPLIRQRLIRPSDSERAPSLPNGRWAAQDAPGTVWVSTRWARPGSDVFDQEQVLAFSLMTAIRLVDGEQPQDAGSTGSHVLCGARGVATLWLAVGATDAGRSAYEITQRHSPGPIMAPFLESSFTLVGGFSESSVVTHLMGKDVSEVDAVLQQNWRTLMDPATSVDTAAQLFGVHVTPPPADAGLC